MRKSILIKELDQTKKAIDSLIARRDELIYELGHTMSLKDQLIGSGNAIGSWVINKHTNTYYQFGGFTIGRMICFLIRNGIKKPLDVSMLNNDYRLATGNEIKQHMDFLCKDKPNTIVLPPYVIKPIEVIHPVTDSYKVNHGKTQVLPKFDSMKCDFYMVTCRGLRGAKVRHTSYEEAEAEAIKIAKKENHETWIVGVVASVKPVVETIVSVKVNKR